MALEAPARPKNIETIASAWVSTTPFRIGSSPVRRRHSGAITKRWAAAPSTI
jgi:hypothetical protein